MLPFGTVHAITDQLLTATAPLDALCPMTLLLLHEPTGQGPEGAQTVRTHRFRLSALAVHCRKPEHMLHEVAGHLTPPGRSRQRPVHCGIEQIAAAVPGRRVLAWAVEYEHTTPGDASRPAHYVDGLDVDGRAYRLCQRPGDVRTVVEVDDDPELSGVPGPWAGLAALHLATAAFTPPRGGTTQHKVSAVTHWTGRQTSRVLTGRSMVQAGAARSITWRAMLLPAVVVAVVLIARLRRHRPSTLPRCRPNVTDGRDDDPPRSSTTARPARSSDRY